MSARAMYRAILVNLLACRAGVARFERRANDSAFKFTAWAAAGTVELVGCGRSGSVIRSKARHWAEIIKVDVVHEFFGAFVSGLAAVAWSRRRLGRGGWRWRLASLLVSSRSLPRTGSAAFCGEDNRRQGSVQGSTALLGAEPRGAPRRSTWVWRRRSPTW